MKFDRQIEHDIAVNQYDRASKESLEKARLLKTAAVFIEVVDLSRMNSTSFRIVETLQREGLLGESEDIVSLQARALQEVKNAANSEQHIGDGLAETRDSLG